VLFKGCLVDRPKVIMPATKESSGGHVEHEVYMLEGILLLMDEIKFEYKSRRDNFAQVMVSLACTIDFSPIFQVRS
jgi:hypothetical protein